MGWGLEEPAGGTMATVWSVQDQQKDNMKDKVGCCPTLGLDTRRCVIPSTEIESTQRKGMTNKNHSPRRTRALLGPEQGWEGEGRTTPASPSA
jgi:hypothetical protein